MLLMLVLCVFGVVSRPFYLVSNRVGGCWMWVWGFVVVLLILWVLQQT